MLSRRGFMGASVVALGARSPRAAEATAAPQLSCVCGFIDALSPPAHGIQRFELRLIWARIDSTELATAWTKVLGTSPSAGAAIPCVADAGTWAGVKDAALNGEPIVCSGLIDDVDGAFVMRATSITMGTELASA